MRGYGDRYLIESCFEKISFADYFQYLLEKLGLSFKQKETWSFPDYTDNTKKHLNARGICNK